MRSKKMVVLRWILIVVGGLAVVGTVLMTGGLVRLSRTQPSTEEVELGATNGTLKPCPRSPNCVSTQADPDDRIHFAEPIPYNGRAEEVLERLSGWIEAQNRAEVVAVDERYLRAVFASAVFGFKDDVEILVADEVVHVRSASRVGQGDMGVNRDRYQKIRETITSTE